MSRTKGLHKRLAWADGVLALGIALLSLLYGNLARIPAGEVHRFFEIRITLLNALFAGLFMIVWVQCFRALDLYRPESHGTLRKLMRIGQGCGLMALVLGTYLVLSHTKGPAVRIGCIFFVGSVVYELVRVFGATWIAGRDPQLVVILGTGRRAGKAWREIRTQYHPTVKLVGFVDDRPVEEMAPDIAARYLGNVSDLNDLLLRNVVDELLIAVPMKSCYGMAQSAVSIAEKVGVQIVFMQDMYSTTLRQTATVDCDLFSDLVPEHEQYVAKQAVKRLIDVVGAGIGLVLLSPLFLLVAAAIKATSEGPVFFVQRRYGHRRRIFHMWKFRSMVSNAAELMSQLEEQNEASGPIFKIRRDPRITPFGRFLRASSLDELPQLWNVLIGNMSLVGPRPMSTRDVQLFSEAALMRRFTVKPGITGLWQVSGRSTVSFDRWVQLDYRYIDQWSLTLDLVILAKTIGVVMKGTGAV